MRQESGSRLEMPKEEELSGWDSTPPVSLATGAMGSGGVENGLGCCDSHLQNGGFESSGLPRDFTSSFDELRGDDSEEERALRLSAETVEGQSFPSALDPSVVGATSVGL